jgi:HEAT repeat protein
MSKVDPVEKALDEIGELRVANSPEEQAEKLRTFLRNRSNLVVAKAAKLTCELRLSALVPDLIAAFDRMWVNPAKLDKRCAAMTAIVNALYEFDYAEPEAYLRGIRHVQKEASFGPPVDTAAQMRGMCAQGLLRTHYRDAMAAVTDLLVDPEPPARIGAIRALAANGGEAGALLLRLKVLTGDKDPEIQGESFSGLLAAAGEPALPFVAGYMDSEDEIEAEGAIWALGQSRLSAALTALREKWERTLDRSMRKTLVAALAASRLQEAIDYLCLKLRDSDAETAKAIISALSHYASNDAVRQAVGSAIEERSERALTDAFREHFSAR